MRDETQCCTLKLISNGKLAKHVYGKAVKAYVQTVAANLDLQFGISSRRMPRGATDLKLERRAIRMIRTVRLEPADIGDLAYLT